MSNEELAGLARAGDEDALLTLWNQVRRLAWRFLRPWTASARLAGLTQEDLSQVAFLALLKAVDAFDPGRGFRFSTYFTQTLRAEVFIAAGLRSEKQARDPLRYAVSLDLPASPDSPEDLTLGDLIVDPQAGEPFRQVEAFGDLEPYLAALPEHQRAALYRRYWLDLPLDALARKAHDNALRTLRHPDQSRKLRRLL